MLTLKNEIKLNKPLVDFLLLNGKIYVLTKSNRIYIFDEDNKLNKEEIKLKENPCGMIPGYLFTKDNSIFRLIEVKRRINENILQSNLNNNILQSNLNNNILLSNFNKKTPSKIICTSHNNKYFFLGTVDKKILIYDKKFSLLNTLFGPKSDIEAIFNYGSQIAVISRLDPNILIFNIQKKGYKRFATGLPLDYPHCGVFLSDFEFIIGTEKGISLFNIDRGTPIWSFTTENPVTSMESYQCNTNESITRNLILGTSEGDIIVGQISNGFRILYSLKLNGYVISIKISENDVIIGNSTEPRNGRWIVKNNGDVKISTFKIESI